MNPTFKLDSHTRNLNWITAALLGGWLAVSLSIILGIGWIGLSLVPLGSLGHWPGSQ